MDPVVRELRALRQLVAAVVVLAILVLAFVFLAKPALDRRAHELDCQDARAAGVYRSGCD